MDCRRIAVGRPKRAIFGCGRLSVASIAHLASCECRQTRPICGARRWFAHRFGVNRLEKDASERPIRSCSTGHKDPPWPEHRRRKHRRQFISQNPFIGYALSADGLGIARALWGYCADQPCGCGYKFRIDRLSGGSGRLGSAGVAPSASPSLPLRNVRSAHWDAGSHAGCGTCVAHRDAGFRTGCGRRYCHVILEAKVQV